ncbi:MAG: hypothetical protein H0U44_04395 [Flavisolibacter sp.]|jgi:hypothetical protein|nr:hypothetical protein [Flavisolibacter sp.]
MKKTLLLLSVIIVTLTSCLDTFEEFTIAQDGSGTYRSSMDMSGMMEMMEMMAAMDTSANKEMRKMSEQNVDSSFKLAHSVDTATDLTAEQKRLFREAEMFININQKEKLFKMSMLFPFKTLDDVNRIIAYNEKGNGVGLFNKKDKNPMSSMAKESGMPNAGDYFIITFSEGLVERKIDEKKLAESKKENGVKDVPEMEGMLEGITYKTVFHFPRPIKNLKGKKAVLSDDKKTVTIRSTMADLLENPDALAFRIEY